MTHPTDGNPDNPPLASRAELKDARAKELHRNLPVSDFVQIVLDRMDNHPQEFWSWNPTGNGPRMTRVGDTVGKRLQSLVSEVDRHLNSKERRLYHEKLRDIAMDEAEHWAMFHLLNGGKK